MRQAHWLLGAILAMALTGTASAQQMLQTGRTVPGRALKSVTQNVAGDAGPANGGPPGTGLTELNITSTLNNGQPFCINDAPITASGGYHQLCMGANSGGGGLMSYNAFGGAAPLPLQFNLNGTTYQFPFALSGILGPATSTIGHPAVWSNGVGTLLNMPDQMQLTPVIAVIPGDSPANSAFWVNATRSGVATGPNDNALMHLQQVDSMTDMVTSRGIDTIFIDHAFGGGEGSRSAIFASLHNTGPTAGGSVSDGHQFYTAIFGNNQVTSTDGGTPSQPRGDFFGLSSQVALEPAATNIHGAIGAEFDVGAMAGSSLAEKMILQLVLFDNDAVHGTNVDAGIVIVGGQPTSTLNHGIDFGKPGTTNSYPFNVKSNIIVGNGNNDSGAQASNGIDFHNISFTGCAFTSKGFCVADGIFGIYAQRQFPTLTFDDTLSGHISGSLVRLISAGTTPDSYEWQINTAVNGDFSSVITAYQVLNNGIVNFFLPPVMNEGLSIGPAPAGPPGPPPPLGYYTMYVDSADGNKLKVSGHNGTVTVLALP